MVPIRKWTKRVRVAGRQLRKQRQTVRGHVQHRLPSGHTLTRAVLAVVLLIMLVSVPAVAPPSDNGNGTGDGGDGSGIVSAAVCNSEISTLGSAIFTLLILALSAFGVYRVGDGFRKYGDPRSDVKRKGIESVKGGVYSFAGAIFVLVSPDLLTKLGLNFADCISITGI